MRADALIEQLPEALIVADREGRIVNWNAAAVRVFGYPAGAAIGQLLDIVIPDDLREAHWRGFRRAVEERSTQYEGRAVPTRAVRGDGVTIYVELAFAIVTSDHDEVLVVATARDITERFERERANRRRLRELEAAQRAEDSNTP